MNIRFSLVILAAATSIAVVGCMPGQVKQSPPSQNSTLPDPSSQIERSTALSSSTSSTVTPVTTVVTVASNPGGEISESKTAVVSNSDSAKDGLVKSCVVKMAVVDIPDSPLNVLSEPMKEDSKVVGQVQNGDYLTVEKEQAGWFQITQPLQGWVAKTQTKSGCNEKVEQVLVSGGGQSIQIGDRFIGTGYHQYLLNGSKGQMMTIIPKQGPFPMIMAPNGKAIVSGPDDQRRQWSGRLPESGEYTLQFDSHHKGYAYAVVVELK